MSLLRKLSNFLSLKKWFTRIFILSYSTKQSFVQSCFLEDVTTFYSEIDAFKYSIFPSTILECNKLDRKIRQSSILLTLRKSLLKIGRPAPKPVYTIRNPNGLKLLTRLGFGLSCVNEHKFSHNFKDCVNVLCSSSLEAESISRFFLRCRYFTDIQKTLPHELRSVNFLNPSDNELAELFLYVSSNFKLQQNCNMSLFAVFCRFTMVRISDNDSGQWIHYQKQLSKIFYQVCHKMWKIQWFNSTVKCVTYLYFCLFLQSQICIFIITPHSH